MPVMPRRLASRLAAAVLVAFTVAASGCSTVSTLNSAARNIDTYSLNPLPPLTTGGGGARIVFVADPSMPGALSSDRIVIKPSAIQVTLLPDGRWVEPAPTHIRNVLSRSLSNTNRFAFVTSGSVGPLPDFTLLTDVDGFQAQLQGTGARITVSMTLTVVRDADSRLVATRRFSRVADAPDTHAISIVSAFEAANRALLADAIPWATTVMTGRGAGT